MTRIDELFYDVTMNTRDADRKSRALADEIGRLDDHMDDAAKSTEKLGKSQKRAGRDLDAAGKKTKGMSDQLNKLATRALAAVAAFVGFSQMGRILKEISTETRKMNSVMGQVATLTDMAGQSFDLLTDRVTGLSLTLPKTADDLGAGLYQTMSSGVTDASDALKVLEASAMLASAGLLDTQTSVDAVTTVMNAYSMDARQASTVTDVFFQTVALGKITVPQLAANIGKVATSASLAGVSIEDLGSALATMTKLGVNAERSSTSLNNLFLQIVDAQDSTKKAAAEMGIEWSATALRAKGLSEFLREVAVATDGDVEALASLGISLEAAQSLFVLAGGGAEEFARVQDGMADSAGATAEAMAKVNETYDAQFQLIKNRLNRAYLELGEKILPMVLDALEQITARFEIDFERRIRRLREIGADPDLIVGLLKDEEIRSTNEALDETRRLIEEIGAGPGNRAGQQINAKFALEAARDEAERLTVEVERQKAALGLTNAEYERLFASNRAANTEAKRTLVTTVEQLEAAEDRAVRAAETLDLIQAEKELQEQLNMLVREGVEIEEEAGAATGLRVSEFLNLAAAARAANEEIEKAIAKIAIDDITKTDPFFAGLNQTARIEPEVVPQRSMTGAESVLAQLGDRIALLTGLETTYAESQGQLLEVETQLTDLLTSNNEELTDRGEFLEDTLDAYRDLRAAVIELRTAENELADAVARGDQAGIRAAQDKLRKGVIGVANALRDAKDAADDADDSMGNLGGKAREIEQLARGILSVADAMGILDENTRSALNGAIDLASSIEDIATNGFSIGNVAMGIGGAIGIAKGIGGLLGFGGGGDDKGKETVDRNTRALADLESAIQRLADGLLDLPIQGVAEAVSRSVELAARDRARVDEDRRNEGERGTTVLPAREAADFLRDQLANLGLTMDDARAVAEALGIEWQTSTEFLENFAERLREIELADIFDTFVGRLRLMRTEFELLDIDDPVERMQKFLAVLGDFSNIDVEAFDVSTPEGRAQLDQFIRTLLQDLPGMSAEEVSAQFGGLTVNQVLDLLRELESLSDDADGSGPSGDEGDPTFTRNVQITEASAGRLLALTATQVTRLDQLYDLAVERNALLGMIPGVNEALSSDSQQTAGSVSLSVDVSLEGQVTGDQDAAELGQIVGTNIIETVDRGLGIRQTRSDRSLGLL